MKNSTFLKHVFLAPVFCVFFFVTTESEGQSKIYFDRSLRRTLDQTIDNIYGLDFEKSSAKIEEIEEELGEHPAVYLVKAFHVYWQKKPFKMGSSDFKLFESYLLKSLQLSNQILEKDDRDIEAAFFALSAHAYLAQLYVDNNEKLKALAEAKSCYGYIVSGFDWVEKYPEYYFPCGIYNYYREKYPEENPFFKPFLWFFRSGDKEEGLEMLKKGAHKSIFTKVENLNYLFHIYLRYENQPLKALPYASRLHKMYPANLTFTSHYAEALIRSNMFAQAKPAIDSLMAAHSRYDSYVGHIFKGIYLEKHLNDVDGAIKMYNLADQIGKQLDMRSPHLDSYLFCGLGRSYLKKDDQQKAENFFRMAYKTAEYNLVKNEAEAYLEKL